MKSIKNGNYMQRLFDNFKKNPLLYFLILPGFIYLVIFHYIPMYGVVIVFKDYKLGQGIMTSPWIGLKNFKDIFNSKMFLLSLKNSIILSGSKLIFSFPMPVILAILLNEVRHMRYKKAIQTIIYLPHFISWVVISSVLILFLSPTQEGLVNYFIVKSLHREPVALLTNEAFFRPLIIMSSIWKEAGWGTIIYIASISKINPEYYEAAIIDGATRFKQIIYITWPFVRSTVLVVFILSMGWFLSVGFEQIYLLQNTLTLDVSEVIETYTYKVGLQQGRFSFSTAVGIFQSIVGMTLLLISNFISKRLSGQGLW